MTDELKLALFKWLESYAHGKTAPYDWSFGMQRVTEDLISILSKEMSDD